MPSTLPNIPIIPSFQKALVQDEQGNPKITNNSPVPKLSPGDILVKTMMVALNPCDYKMGAAFPSPGAVIGNDFVGTVVLISEETSTRSDISIGDTVCGPVHGSNPADRSNGAFTEYVRVSADLVLRVPQEFKIEHAAALGLATSTSIVSLWEGGLGLEVNPENPAKESFPVLVYGASTSMGTMALQLLKLSGLEPIATCSPHNFDLVRSYGARVVFDYADPETPAKIKNETGGDLEYALDIISDSDSVTCCYGSISRFGGNYTCLELCSEELLQKRRTIEVAFPMALEVFGKELELSRGYERPASKKKHLAAVRLFKMFQRLLDEGKLKAHPVRVLSPGIETVVEGLNLLKSGNVSGQKLVVPIS